MRIKQVIIILTVAFVTLGLAAQERAIRADRSQAASRNGAQAASNPASQPETAPSNGRRHALRAPLIIQIEGTLTAVAPDSITVQTESKGAFDAAIDSSTQVWSNDQLVTVDTLQIGDHVHVRALDSGGSLLAQTIVDQTDTSGETENVEVKGTVTAVASDGLDIQLDDGTSVHLVVDASTVVTMGGQPFAFADIVVGMIVEAEGLPIDPTTIQATSINVEEDQAVEMSVFGQVTAIGDMTLTLNTVSQGVVTVQVDASTRIKKRGTPIAFTDIMVGDMLEAEGAVVTPGTILANSIVVQQTGNETANINGVIESIGTNQLTVTTERGPVVVNVADTTTIKRDGSTAAFTDLVVGDQVHVKGTWNGADVDATSIQAESQDSSGTEQAEISGTINAVDTTALTITVQEENGTLVTVQVGADTTIQLDGAASTLDALVAGDKVEVQGTWNGDILVASSVDAETQEAEISGTINAVDTTALTITVQEEDGTLVTVQVGVDTTIQLDGAASTLDALVAGDKVEVQGVWSGDVLIASSVDAESV